MNGIAEDGARGRAGQRAGQEALPRAEQGGGQVKEQNRVEGMARGKQHGWHGKGQTAWRAQASTGQKPDTEDIVE